MTMAPAMPTLSENFVGILISRSQRACAAGDNSPRSGPNR